MKAYAETVQKSIGAPTKVKSDISVLTIAKLAQ